ncbi:MAG TPA: ATP-binding protein [Gemmataceae bacterium]|nr:ATP-binding protein [Gemmataceae bacterium]
MTAVALPLEDLLRQTLDRLARQEERTEVLEAALSRLAPPTAHRHDTPAEVASQTKALARLETPHTIPWPPKRVQELEARLAAAEQRVAEAEARAERAEESARQAEERLRQARRLETVGRLVAGVAHDFNNLLTVISGAAEIVQGRLPPLDPLREPAELIASTARTAVGVARQLLALGKPHPGGPVLVDVNAAVHSAERWLRRLAGDQVELDLVLSLTLPPIRIDPGQFDQVLLNLVTNARDAIPDSGTVTVQTAVADGGPHRPGWPAHMPGGSFVALTVTDTGTGMTEQVKARVFDPFFTTKGQRGTGLGLSTVLDIVRAAGGHIEVESSPEWGTSVRVYWPLAEPSRRSGLKAVYLSGAPPPDQAGGRCSAEARLAQRPVRSSETDGRHKVAAARS